jgi:deoxyribodipyrimidine photo-lyase
MLRGLRFVEADLQGLSIAFRVLVGANPAEELARYAKAVDAQHIVTDFSPLRAAADMRDDAVEKLGAGCGFEYVDAHNVVPVWVASDKIESAAATIRKKIQNRLPEFLTNFPPLFMLDKFPFSDAAVLPAVRAEARATAVAAGLASGPSMSASSSSSSASAASGAAVVAGPAPTDPDTGLTDWAAVAGALEIDWSVPEVGTVLPGERQAEAALGEFLEHATRVDKYHIYHQDATRPEVCSGLSPYLHFGQLSAQRCCLELLRVTERSVRDLFVPRASDGFQAWADEILVRRELSENFCLYEEKVSLVPAVPVLWLAGWLAFHVVAAARVSSYGVFAVRFVRRLSRVG